MPEYLAPGVYVEEVSFSPATITGVSTSTTAFIGVTERGPSKAPVALSSMAEFEQVFGGAPHPMFRLEKHTPRTGTSPLSAEGATQPAEMPEITFQVGSETYALVQTNPVYALHAAIRMFFVNGGGRCVVVSCGAYGDAFDSAEMLDALNTLKAIEDPNLIVIPEVTRLPRAGAATVNQAALAQCEDGRNRFAILDIPGGYLDRTDPRGDPIAAFRDDIGTRALSFGASYYPWLETAMFHPEDFTFANIEPDSRPLLATLLTKAGATPEAEGISAPTLTGDFTIVASPGQTVQLTLGDFRAVDDSPAKRLRYSILDTGRMTGRIVTTGTGKRRSGFRQKGLVRGRISFARDADATDPGQFEIAVIDKDGQKTVQRTVFVVSDEKSAAIGPILQEIAADETEVREDVRARDHTLRRTSPLYAEITRRMAVYANTLPPGAAMAGIYARTDNARGVWKAPAGVSLNAVRRPAIAIGDREQGALTAPNSGPSINAIRSFTGRGILVWGARTMASRDNEWRYVPVRRFAIMVEQSVRLSTQPLLFEENDADVWQTIHAMVGNFLGQLWRSGALAGRKPSEAYFVKVGLGETMTQDDVLNGRLIVDIGIAPVRPAEFVIIRIQQKTQSR